MTTLILDIFQFLWLIQRKNSLKKILFMNLSSMKLYASFFVVNRYSKKSDLWHVWMNSMKEIRLLDNWYLSVPDATSEMEFINENSSRKCMIVRKWMKNFSFRIWKWFVSHLYVQITGLTSFLKKHLHCLE